jgi:two-component system, NarL family, nitrate/nitrite response regulator NarL
MAVTHADEVGTSPRVLVVARVRAHADALVRSLGVSGRYAVSGTVTGEDGILERAGTLRPDIVLLDLSPADRDGVLLSLSRLLPKTRIVAIGVTEADDEVIPLVEAGAVGYVASHGSLRDVEDAMDRAWRGEATCSPEITAALMRRLAERVHPKPAGVSALTVRECQVAALLMQGMSNKEIAAQLYIEVATVKNHVHHILEKLHVRRRGEAVAMLAFGRG